MSTVRVRFAPSPTGFLHVGGLRTALYNFLFARQNNGVFILRIEDTDRARYVEGAAANLVKTLRWAGLEYDEGPGIGGPAAPYVQSERISLYKKCAAELLEKGYAYYAFDTPQELEAMRTEQEKMRISPKYDRRALRLTSEEVRQKLESGCPFVVRLKVPVTETITCDDVVRGRVEFGGDRLDDQVLMKSDGYPTYHLANVVDDHFMGVTHVIRGEEWLSSTPKHVLLYRYFGWDMPVFAHLPLLLNPDKSKLSKRQGDVAVEDYRRKGYLPEALVNFVAFLGWNPGDEREVLSREELIRDFSLDRVGKAGAVFNVEKLQWLNAQYLRAKSDAELLHVVRAYDATASGIAGNVSDEVLVRIIAVMRERATFAADFVEKCPYLYGPPETYDAEAVAKRWKPETASLLRAFIEECTSLENQQPGDFESAVERTAGKLNVKKSEIIHPLRLAVSGVSAGPGLYDILAILGKDQTVKRIIEAIAKLDR